ncbi:MAG: alanine racemase [Candidatus Eisenbacteria bacterium]|uniref:Alanine racemase n=1 Tax=Eiseniibacteriota bacterium TaxID=2212470 RepID=A0A956M4N2_UNCEI|nr:alanine racemase [Candidatus Eisenbacteria bacterium]
MRGSSPVPASTPTPASPVRDVRHSSRIELSESALRKNLAFLRSRVGAKPIISSVVKANAYGHGIVPFVAMAQRLGIRHFSVASSYEASCVLEEVESGTTILIMGILYSADLPWVIEHGIEFFVFDRSRLEEAARVAEEVGRPARIHLEVETGGNRLGLPEADLGAAVRILKDKRAHLQFVGLCTHFAGMESLANQFRIRRQLARFQEITKRLGAARCVPELRHTACSAAALAFPETVMDLVRIGTAQYGMWPSPDIEALVRAEVGERASLHRVLSWKTDIMHIKDVREDDFVGYGTSFQAPRKMRIGVIPVGYGTGLPRGLSNRGQVLVHGRRAPIVGLVNMNACMIDLTHIPAAEIGDEVVLVGKQKNNVISIRSFSEFTNALNNEFLCRLPNAIPRTVVR